MSNAAASRATLLAITKAHRVLSPALLEADHKIDAKSRAIWALNDPENDILGAWNELKSAVRKQHWLELALKALEARHEEIANTGDDADVAIVEAMMKEMLGREDDPELEIVAYPFNLAYMLRTAHLIGASQFLKCSLTAIMPKIKATIETFVAMSRFLPPTEERAESLAYARKKAAEYQFIIKDSAAFVNAYTRTKK